MLSDVMEDYLKAIYMLQRDEEPPVSTSAIAEYLDVTPPTVTSMVSKLEAKELLAHEKYKGVELTQRGETVALEVLRHHRLLEAYLAEQLDYDLNEVHEEADALEHHISEAFEQRVADLLDEPALDPHGDPIPTADLEPLADDDTAALSANEEGDRFVVARVSDRDQETLSYLESVGIEPGTELRLTERTPIGLLTVEVGGETQSLPEALAHSIRVRPVERVDETA